MKTNAYLWAILFVLLFFLSQDYLFITWPAETSFLGFPVWLGWFILVHMLFIVAFAYFAYKFWKA